MGRQAQKRASRPRAPEGSHPPPRQQPYSADVTKRRYKAPDHHVNAAVERNVASPGHGVEQEVAAQHPAGPAHKFAQEGKLAPRQCDGLAGFVLKLASVKVENQPREAKRSALLVLRAPPGVTRRVRRSVHHSGPPLGFAAGF